MSIKNKFLQYNLLNRLRIHLMRKRLKNPNFTLFSSNCLGGLVYHELGLNFCSPTINLRFSSPDFVKFICNLKHYLKCEFVEIESAQAYPVAYLDDITIHFVHYHSFEEAIAAWERRIKRINWDNIFVLLNDCDGMGNEEYEQLKNLEFKNICVFTAREYSEYPFCFQLSKYKNLTSVGNTMGKSLLTGRMMVEDEFDFVGWFNQDYGVNLEKYRR